MQHGNLSGKTETDTKKIHHSQVKRTTKETRDGSVDRGRTRSGIVVEVGGRSRVGDGVGDVSLIF